MSTSVTTTYPDRYLQDVLRQLEACIRDAIGADSPHVRASEVLSQVADLSMAKARDVYSHGLRTSHYALGLARAVGFSDNQLPTLLQAAFLHDIGKLTLPDEILHKDGPLSAAEYALLQSHPRAGAEFLEAIPHLRLPALWIAHHHERWDGSGYPYGVRGEFIPLASRILAVADTFDALTLEPTHTGSTDAESAFRLLSLIAGTQLDPLLVQVFLRLRPEIVTLDEEHLIESEWWSGLCHPLITRCTPHCS